MDVTTLSRSCDGARAWISLELDGELTEVEHARLRRHLRLCSACAAYAETAAAFTTTLREAPQAEVRIHFSATRRQRRLRAQVRRVVPALAAAVAMLTVGGTVGRALAPQTDGPTTFPSTPVGEATSLSFPSSTGSWPKPTVSLNRQTLPLGQRNASADF